MKAYDAPTSPAGGVPEIARCSATLSVTALLSEAPWASWTRTVKLDSPLTLEVPDRIPVDGSRLIPAGSVPVETDQMKGLVPPATVNGKLAEATPTTASGRAPELMTGAAAMAIVVDWVAV